MVIFGLHRMLMGIIDFLIEQALHISDISYSILEAIILVLVIELALLAIIIYGKRHCPILLGKKQYQNIDNSNFIKVTKWYHSAL